jgi:hypothetical protein
MPGGNRTGHPKLDRPAMSVTLDGVTKKRRARNIRAADA